MNGSPAPESQGELLRRLFAAALARVAPAAPTAAALAGLDLAGPVVLLATGKASLAMAAGAEEALGERIRDRVLVAPAGSRVPSGIGHAAVREACHPVPDARSEAAGRALLAAAAAAGAEQDLVVLISGGGSALSAVPATGLLLADKAEAIARLMAAGAPIADLNCVRRHLSALKGGHLARATVARVTTLVVSDVIGDALHEVASGPTVPDPTTFADACGVVERWIGWDALPRPVARHLDAGRRGLVPENLAAPRPGDRAMLVLGLGALVEAAAEEARQAEGVDLPVEVLPDRLEGAVEDVARFLAGQVSAISRRGGGLLIAGGEPTVALPAHPGRSGRAHHLALLLARSLAGHDASHAAVAATARATILVAGSDGMDGQSGAAGAVVDRQTWNRIAAAGVDPDAYLSRFDAAAALAAAGAQITTGPTGVNHADLVLACCHAPEVG